MQSDILLDKMAERWEHVRPDQWEYAIGGWRVKAGKTHTVDVIPLMFTAAIVITPLGGTTGYDDRWCYRSLPEAFAAAEAWDVDVDEEPAGWFRHPMTGRRRENGDPASEVVTP